MPKAKAKKKVQVNTAKITVVELDDDGRDSGLCPSLSVEFAKPIAIDVGANIADMLEAFLKIKGYCVVVEGAIELQ